MVKKLDEEQKTLVRELLNVNARYIYQDMLKRTNEHDERTLAYYNSKVRKTYTEFQTIKAQLGLENKRKSVNTKKGKIYFDEMDKPTAKKHGLTHIIFPDEK